MKLHLMTTSVLLDEGIEIDERTIDIGPIPGICKEDIYVNCIFDERDFVKLQNDAISLGREEQFNDVMDRFESLDSWILNQIIFETLKGFLSPKNEPRKINMAKVVQKMMKLS